MKTNLIRLVFLFLAVTGLSLSGCKKDKNTGASDDSASMQQLSKDEEAVESASEESMNDVNNLLAGGSLKSTERRVPCNAKIDSTAVVNDTITIYITYNGVNCMGNRFRSGKVEIKKQVGTHWFQQGATVMVRHIDFAITKMKNQKMITLNGVRFYQNVSGGLIWQIGPDLPTIVHRTWGYVNISFEDGTTKTWNIARQNTFSGIFPDNLSLTSDGFGTVDGYENLVAWGLNRHGENFYTQILQPVTRCENCNWDPLSGITKHSIPAGSKSATLTFGYDENDQPVVNECPSKYKLDWQRNNKSGTIFLWL